MSESKTYKNAEKGAFFRVRGRSVQICKKGVLFARDTWRFVWKIMNKSRVWNDFLKNMCSKDITLVSECVLWLGLSVLNFAQKLDLFGETLFFYPVANAFSQMGWVHFYG